jgi:hypothetical protein
LPAARFVWADQIEAVLMTDVYTKVTTSKTKAGLVVHIAVSGYCSTPKTCSTPPPSKAQALANFLTLSTKAVNKHLATKVVIKVARGGKAVVAGGAPRSPAAAGTAFQQAMLGNSIFSSVSAPLGCVRVGLVVVDVRLDGKGTRTTGLMHGSGHVVVLLSRPHDSTSTAGELKALGIMDECWHPVHVPVHASSLPS